MKRPSAVALAFAAAVACGTQLLTTQPSAAQVPDVPATFYGSATIDGGLPPVGSPVRGFVDGRDCTQPGAMGTIAAGSVGAYVISVMHESQQPGCGREGAAITFTIAGREAGQSATWKRGPQELGLNAGTGAVQPLPPGIPTPAAAQTAVTPGGAPTLVTAGGSTPRPPGVSPDEPGDDDDGPGVAGVVLTGLAVIALAGGVAGWLISRRLARRSAQAP